MTADHGFHSPEGRKEETQSGPRLYYWVMPPNTAICGTSLINMKSNQIGQEVAGFSVSLPQRGEWPLGSDYPNSPKIAKNVTTDATDSKLREYYEPYAHKCSLIK